MSSEVHWTHAERYDPAIERLKSFTEPLAPVVAKPSDTHLQEFADVIENVIVPRLLMSHVRNAEQTGLRQQPLPPAEKERVSVRNVAVMDFVSLTMQDDPDRAINYVQHLLDSGVAFQDVLLELMAPAARALGEMWESDSASFVEVALGVARMHRILRRFDGVPAHLWSNGGMGRHALLLPAPGEQHTFGLRLVQEFLLRESWTVTNQLVGCANDLLPIISTQHFDIAGLSLSGETLIEPFLSAIRLIRAKSLNPNIKIIVGGHLFVERPELVSACGSDGYAVDAPATVRVVNSWAKQLAAAT